ncbi:unnamed protein product [Brassicogethes aeneus]|uniref:V-type proton ATPase subunit S1 n=1 Tax=Brassicogethes aeneus TaxID=1431903 RepID=A0A9P0B4J3_BRAAE|nr:unnamed protein product [Brassicogethes aeneus]
MLGYFLIPFLLCLSLANAAVLIWSNKDIKLSPLKQFDDEDLNNLKVSLNNPRVFLFKSPTSEISLEFKKIISGYKSAYNPNGNINAEQAIELSDIFDSDFKIIKQTINTKDFLAVLYIPNTRFKREVEGSSSTTSTTVETIEFKKPEGPVIYVGQNKDKLYTLMYSSKPLLLRVKDEKIYLGTTPQDMITVDKRLNVNVVLENGDKVSLRFSFITVYGYWSMTSVKITDTMNNMNFNLNITSDVTASVHFSYHCSGQTVFADKANDVELYLYDMQIQIDSENGKFSDADDCVPFTSAPIWSGLFVTFLLGFVLMIALVAILDIKTMDKFDNAKTKNLSITIFD